MQVCRGGDEISFTNMGLVAEMVLAQVCVRLVSSFGGRLARGGWFLRHGGLVSEVVVLRWPLYVGCCGGSTPLLGGSGGRLALLLENVKKCDMS